MNFILTESLKTRFWTYVNKLSEDECWPWTGGLNSSGYGRINLGERGAGVERAHRVSWTIQNGYIKDGLCVLHKCDNPKCVNPSHLFLGTKGDNYADMRKKGRAKNPPTHIGDAHPNAKLTSEQISQIRLMNKSALELASIYNVSRKTIYSILRGDARRC